MDNNVISIINGKRLKFTHKSHSLNAIYALMEGVIT